MSRSSLRRCDEGWDWEICGNYKSGVASEALEFWSQENRSRSARNIGAFLVMSTSDDLHICLTVDRRNADICKQPTTTLINNQCII
jgi:hypothetical protein